MTAHVWAADGLDDDGRTVGRCKRCGCLSTWPIAGMSCCQGVRLPTEAAAARKAQRAAERERRARRGGYGGSGSSGHPTHEIGSVGRVGNRGAA